MNGSISTEDNGQIDYLTIPCIFPLFRLPLRLYNLQLFNMNANFRENSRESFLGISLTSCLIIYK